MSIRQLPSARWTIPGNSGAVPAGYYVYTYQPGTSTPKATYTDHTGNTANTNPVVLDARGEANIWWDGVYKVAAYTGDKDAGGVLVWSQDNYGEGTSAVLQGNFNLVLNGSFEQDANGDDLPDDWTIVEYTDGQVERDSIEQIHGSYSLKFTSVGTGGGYADSTLFEVQEARVLPVSFALKSSIATVHNQVDVVWYTAAGSVLSTTTMYDDDTTNPTDWTTFSYTATPPTNARFGKVRIFGCKDDNATPGSVWFDNVIGEAPTVWREFFPNIDANVTASDEELNILDGLTASTAELNILSGATVTADEINLLDGKVAVGIIASSEAPALSAGFDITTNIGSSWESVGPTGSGATNIWATLDVVPEGVAWVEIAIYNALTEDTGELATQAVLARATGSAIDAVENTIVSRSNVVVSAGIVGVVVLVGEIYVRRIPVDSSRRFDLYRGAAGGTLSCVAHLVGWG